MRLPGTVGALAVLPWGRGRLQQDGWGNTRDAAEKTAAGPGEGAERLHTPGREETDGTGPAQAFPGTVRGC